MAFAQRSQEKLYFEHPDMDYYLSLVLGRQLYQGSDKQECMGAAARIRNGDARSWQRAWLALAEQVEQQAQLSGVQQGRPTQDWLPNAVPGTAEAPITLQIAHQCFEQLSHPLKKLVIFTRAQGGEAHCQVDNLALPNGVLFDWLDQLFDQPTSR